ncbi:MAG: RNA polymerase sigma factor [Spirochaetaceae bacterium]|jgi:RNA polymerase sigma-70 factor (ECF subfamily)|nr:RNA polymerase sigma factor [Spirochaetaceae bacterium]
MPLSDFKKLYDMAFPILFRIAWRIAGSEDVAEDLCHEAFSRLYEKDMNFPNLDEAKYWLIRVVKNIALNYAKRKQREIKVYEKAFRENKREQLSAESVLAKKETVKDVREALLKLPPSLQEVLILKEYTEFNYQEIGRALGITEGNVKVRVFRARERLQKILEGEYGN